MFAVLIMGFTESEARLGLRACQGDTTLAIDYITKRRRVSVSYRVQLILNFLGTRKTIRDIRGSRYPG